MEPEVGVERLAHGKIHAHHGVVAKLVRSGRTFLYRLGLIALSKCKRLCPAEFRSLLLDTSQTTLTSVFVPLIIHFNIILRKAPHSVFFKERTVSSVQNINFRIGELRVLVCVIGPVFVTYELGPAFMLV
jgi:hypothetical protein